MLIMALLYKFHQCLCILRVQRLRLGMRAFKEIHGGIRIKQRPFANEPRHSPTFFHWKLNVIRDRKARNRFEI